MMAGRQWLRYAQVVIGKNGSGISVDTLRIKFSVKKTIRHEPNTAVISIYNLSPNNVAAVKKEYDDIILNAGYEDPLIVFRGNIKHVYHYKDGLDWVTEIHAADGDTDHRLAVINETLAAGTTNHHAIEKCVGTFKGGTTLGHVSLPVKTRTRGKVLSGSTRDTLHEVARDGGANWSIQDGELVIVGAQGTLPGEAIVVNSETGLLKTPEIDDKGISVTCQLNPRIKVNGALHLDNNRLRQKAKDDSQPQSGKKPAASKDPVRLDPDGVYKVITLEHKGDTHGSEWESDVTCIGLDQPIPPENGVEDDRTGQITDTEEEQQ